MTTAKKTRASASRAKKATATAKPRGTAKPAAGKVQGEGDYASAREFNRDEREFVASNDTEELARRAAPDDAAQAAELDAAERKGKERAKPDPEAGDEDDDTNEDAHRSRG